ncbi:hypothetical protein D3C73_1321350 [compost metagenome]
MILIAASCGCWRFSAIFSGMMCTHQNTLISATGTITRATHEMPLASASSASPSSNEARAGRLHASTNNRTIRRITIIARSFAPDAMPGDFFGL